MFAVTTTPSGDYLLRIGPGVPPGTVSPTPAALSRRSPLAGTVAILVSIAQATAAVVALLIVATTVPAMLL